MEEKKPVNPYTEARKKANKKWDAEHGKSFGVFMPLDVYNKMEKAIDAVKRRDPSMTRGKFVREAVERAIEDAQTEIDLDNEFGSRPKNGGSAND